MIIKNSHGLRQVIWTPRPPRYVHLSNRLFTPVFARVPMGPTQSLISMGWEFSPGMFRVYESVLLENALAQAITVRLNQHFAFAGSNSTGGFYFNADVGRNLSWDRIS